MFDKPTLAFTVRQKISNNPHYAHLHIGIVVTDDPRDLFSYPSRREIIHFEWQTDRDKVNDTYPWYAGNLSLNRWDRIGEFKFMTRFVNALHNYMVKASYRILRKVYGYSVEDANWRKDGKFENDPQKVIDALLDMGLTQVVKDTRLNEYLPLHEVAGPEWDLWRDTVEEYSQCHVLARSETEAQTLLRDAEWYSERKRQAWLDMGSPVRNLSYEYRYDARGTFQMPVIQEWNDAVIPFWVG